MSFLNKESIKSALFSRLYAEFVGEFLQSMKSFSFNHAAKLQKVLSPREWKHWVATQGKKKSSKLYLMLWLMA